MDVQKFIGLLWEGKTLTNASYDEQSAITTIYFEDGSFERLTIYQVEGIDGFMAVNPPLEEIVTEGTEKVELIENPEPAQAVEPYDAEPLAKYRLLQPIPYTDENGVEMGTAEVGSVQEVPVQLGEAWVAQGMAEPFMEEVTNDNPEPNA